MWRSLPLGVRFLQSRFFSLGHLLKVLYALARRQNLACVELMKVSRCGLGYEITLPAYISVNESFTISVSIAMLYLFKLLQMIFV